MSPCGDPGARVCVQGARVNLFADKEIVVDDSFLLFGHGHGDGDIELWEELGGLRVRLDLLRLGPA